MTRGVPMIDPKMFGDATPEDVARALLRNRLLPRRRVKRDGEENSASNDMEKETRDD